jgi:MOSC domain-containing protein YiiM
MEKYPIEIAQIYLSMGHNYFGHHGGPSGTHPVQTVAEVECVAGQGLRGDRFFGHKENYKGQVTFFSWEVYEDLCRRFNVRNKPPSVFRRNVMTCGVNLSSLIGKNFSIQGIAFEGVCECAPCYWMDEAFAPGAEEALKGRGGLRARILSTGILRVVG